MPALIRAFDHFWANDPGPGGVGLQDRYAAAWAQVAARFASARYTLGFDLMNEPWPGTPWASCAVPTGCPAFDTGALTPFFQRVIAQIRAVEPQKLLWYEANVLFDFGADTSIPPLGDSSAGLSFHTYCVPSLGGIGGLAGAPCEALTDHVFQNADKHAEATGDALILSEFGATDDLNSIRSDVRQADRHMVSWEYWHYCECQDPTTSGSGTQAVVIDPSQPPTGANVKQAKLDVLSEPYPQVVAGTPHSYGFDDATRTFELSYSTKGPSGKNFARKQKKHRRRSKTRSRRTQIFLGRRHYPKGYRASIDGGGIASKPNARLLKVVACPRRRNVSVTVRPASPGARNHVDCKIAGRRPKHKR
jgi:endoglycosylceramidase